MKKTLFILLALLPIMVNAQFKLTIDGFVSSDDESKNFIIMTIPDKSLDELYLETLKFIHTVYKVPDAVINEVKGEMITVSGFAENAVGTGKVLGAYLATWNMNYTISLQFKEGRVRVDAPNFECTGYSDGKETRLLLYGKTSLSVPTRSLFKKDGKPNMKDSIKMIEDYFNGFINGYDNYINKLNRSSCDRQVI